MRFYTNSHQHYCGVDLHTKTRYLCILDSEGNILLHKNINANPQTFLKVIDPYRQDLAVGVECMFSWYWLANICLEQGITFLLGHALYMKSIHGGKTKSDKIDSEKIARLIRVAISPWPTSTLPRSEPCEICCAGDVCWCVFALKCWHISKSLTINTMPHFFSRTSINRVYARLVKCPKESAGKLYGYGGQKMGNAHLKWAFSEATITGRM
jgi:transposase